jgi:parallel beta-helix repeat protein
MKTAACMVMLVVFAATGWAATIEVSGATHMTTNVEYDRNPSIVYDGSNYWLFWTKGDDTSTAGVRGGGYDPDADTYVIYYKTAGTLVGLASAAETKLALSETARPVGFDQRVVSATYFGGDIYAFASSGQSGIDKGLYYYKWDGASWTGPTTLIADSTARGGHVNVTSDASYVYIVWEATADASSDCYTWDGTTLSAKIDISSDNQPKIALDGTTLYVVSIEDGTGDIEAYSAAAGGTPAFSAHSTPVPGAGFYDPCIVSDGTDLYVITAPWVGATDQQYLVEAVYSGGSWSAVNAVTMGGYGTTCWWDYWPVAYYDGSDVYVFFTTETASPSYSDGEIAMLKMDWDLGNDHYLYVQNAIGAATAGGVVSVAPGLYEEAIVVDKSLTLQGATSGVDKNSFVLPTTLGDYDTAVQSVIKTPAAGDPNAVSIESSNVTLQGFVIEALDRSVTGGNDYNNLIELRTTADTMTGITIKNNVIGPNTDAATQTNGRHGVRITASGKTIGALVTGNKIFGTYGNGNNVFIWGTAYGTTGIPPGGTHPEADLSGTIIENNDICYSARSGVELSGAQTGLTIHNNRIHDNGAGHSGDPDLKWGSGIMFVRDYADVIHGSDPGIGAAAGFVDGVTISDNDVYDNTKNGLYFGPMNRDHTITGNNIHGNGWDGFRLDLEGWYYSSAYFGGAYANAQYASTSNIEFGSGAIHGNTDDGAIVVGTPLNGFVLDASANWWGSADPTTVASVVDGDIDYTPWLGSGTDTSTDPGFQGDFSELWVDDDSPQTGSATRLQEGHDLATGSTVNVADGIYGADPATLKTVYITKDNFSLIGQSEAGTIIDGAVGGVGSSGSSWPKGIHVEANNVTVQNFTVKGFTGDLVSTGGYGVLHRDYAHDTPGEGYIFYNGCTLDNVTVQDCYSAVYALCFTHLTVSDCTVTDNYSDGMFIARGSDYADVHGNVVTNSGDHGIWVGKCWSGLDPSDDATITNNTVNGAREGGISFVGSDGAVIEGNVITNVAGEGWSVGALSLKDGASNVVARYNLIYGNDGTWGGYAGTGHGIGIDGTPANITLNWNSVYGNAGDGCHNYSTVDVDAKHNWWGDASGPGGVGAGSGDEVSTYVLYDPWIGKSGGENIVCDPDPLELNAGVSTSSVGVDYLGGASDLVYLINVVFTWDDTKVTMNSITKGDLFAGLDSAFYVTGTGNSRTVDWTLRSAQPGVPGPGELFRVEFTGVGCGTSPITFTSVIFRNSSNETMTGVYARNGAIQVDLGVPSVSVSITNSDNPHFDDYAKDGDDLLLTTTIGDACGNLDDITVRANLSTLLSGGGSSVAPDDYTGGVATWNLDDVDLAGDGLKTIAVTATDLLGNVGTGSTTTTVDNTNPTAITGFDAAPAHNKVALTWTDPTSLPVDVNFYEVVIRSNAWGTYPTYPGSGPSYPADQYAGTAVWNGVGSSYTVVYASDGSERDIYYCQAFACDKALNYGPAATTARDRATNYWLGDVADEMPNWVGDGRVYDGDFAKLSGTYGSSSPSSPWDQCDVGPTDDHSRLGIPCPDALVNFEDLMIFAMNYDVVAARVVPLLTEPAVGDLALSIEEIGRNADGTVELALRLLGNMGEVKGVSAVLSLDGLEFVSARLSDEMETPAADIFFWYGERDGAVQIDLAMLGTGMTIGGSGELAHLTFVATGDVYSIEFESASLRGAENEDLDADLAGYGSGDELPMAFRLVQNAPNPFNPLTTIAYEVPQASAVTITVYDISGRLVTTLVEGTVDPGRHSVIWDGRNDHGESVGSGVYFCVMETPDYRGSHKMTLLK